MFSLSLFPLVGADTVLADANNLDIPDEVMEHPIIQSLNEATNDLVTWSNVCIYMPSSCCTVMFTTVFAIRTSFRTTLSSPRVTPII